MLQLNHGFTFFSLYFKIVVPHSVTRFVEISLFWQHVESLLQLFEGLFRIGQNFKMTLSILFAFWQIFIVVNHQKLNKLSIHLLTLVPHTQKMLEKASVSLHKYQKRNLFFTKNSPTLMALTGVTNAYGPSTDPIKCNSV